MTALAGCTASISTTTSPDKIAELAADAIEGQVGTRPDVDCGDENIALKQGTKVQCVLTDPSTGSEFDAEVTLSKVDGTNVTVTVNVADTANNAPEETETDAPSTGGATLSLTAAEIGKTAEKALKDAGLLSNPAVVCPGSTHEVTVGYTLECTVIQGGDQYAATVKISEVDGSNYSVNVAIPELAG